MTTGKNSIKNILEFGILKLNNLDNPTLEAEILLMNVINKTRVFFRTDWDYELKDEEIELYKDFIQQRSENIPIAYILEYKDWAGFKIKVNKNVLIPRDETEILVNKIIQDWIKKKICINAGDPSLHKFQQKVQDDTVLDIGTGSGCISVFLAKKLQGEITALDISEKALEVAQKNFEAQNIKATLIESNLLENISRNSYFDIIVANLPYVPEDMIVDTDLSYEPSGAIFSGKDGLDHIRALAKQIGEKNIQFNVLWLEFLPQQKNKISKIFSEYKLKFHTDSGGEVFFVEISE